MELDPVYKVSKLFGNTVTRECFESLVLLLNWAWGTFKLTLNELVDKVWIFCYKCILYDNVERFRMVFTLLFTQFCATF